MCQDRAVVSTHSPIQVTGHGRSSVVVGPDGVAILRHPYDVGQLTGRFFTILVVGALLAAVANSIWPGHLDTIATTLGVVVVIAIVPVIVYGSIAAVRFVVGTAAAITQPRKTLRAMKTVWRGASSGRVADFVAALDPDAVRMVVDHDEIRDGSTVRGWLRPTLDITLGSGQAHRLTTHPWWRRQLTGLARDLRELSPAADR